MTAAAERLVEDMKTVAGDVRELITLTAGQSADTIVSAREKARAAVGRMEEKIAAAQAAAVEKARISAAATNDYVHDSPWRSIGAAALLALAVGFLLGRR